jgi:hypothetical protein
MRRKANGLGSYWGVGGSVLSGAIMLFVAIAAARGDVRLPAIFSHNTVFQQNQDVPVWGWAAPGRRFLCRSPDVGPWPPRSTAAVG